METMYERIFSISIDEIRTKETVKLTQREILQIAKNLRGVCPSDEMATFSPLVKVQWELMVISIGRSLVDMWNMKIKEGRKPGDSSLALTLMDFYSAASLNNAEFESLLGHDKGLYEAISNKDRSGNEP